MLFRWCIFWSTWTNVLVHLSRSGWIFRCSTSNLVLALTLQKVVRNYDWKGKQVSGMHFSWSIFWSTWTHVLGHLSRSGWIFRCSTSNLVLALSLRKVVKDYNWKGKHLLMFSSCIVKYCESRAQNLIFWKGFPNLSKIGVLQLSVFSTFWKFENASNPQDAFQLEHLLKYMDACT